MRQNFLILVLLCCIFVWIFPVDAEKTEGMKVNSSGTKSTEEKKQNQSQAYPSLYLMVSIPIDAPETKEVIIDPLFIQNLCFKNAYIIKELHLHIASA